MRIFVGLEIPPEIADRISVWQKARPNWPVRWTRRENLHVTILPPWETYKPMEEIGKFENTRSVKSFPIRFKEISFGSVSHAPRVIWTTGDVSEDILSLRNSVANNLGRKLETGKFNLHATMARLKPEDFARCPDRNLKEAVDWQWIAGRLVLFESELRPGGAEYRHLAEVDLG